MHANSREENETPRLVDSRRADVPQVGFMNVDQAKHFPQAHEPCSSVALRNEQYAVRLLLFKLPNNQGTESVGGFYKCAGPLLQRHYNYSGIYWKLQVGTPLFGRG